VSDTSSGGDAHETPVPPPPAESVPPAPSVPRDAAPPAYVGQHLAAAPYPPQGPVGNIRGTGVCILLTIVTFGIYSLVWYYKVHDEMKRHSGDGMGGALALVLALFVSIVMPYFTSHEVGQLYERRGHQPPVSALTGLWSFPGVIIVVGPLIWFIKTNGALNGYWRSLGAR
jgi:hypothetical protein